MKTSLFLCVAAATVCFADIKVIVNDAAFLVGERAVIPCKFESSSENLPTYTWSSVKGEAKDRLYVYNKATDQGFKPDGAPREGVMIQKDGSLVINDTTLEDNEILGTLRCEVATGRAGLAEKDLTLTIALLPEEDPNMILNSYPEGQNGFDINDFPIAIASCTSAPSYPAAEITFYKNGVSTDSQGDGVLDEIRNQATISDAPDGSISKITDRDLLRAVDKSDHQADYICNVKTTYGDKVFERNYTMPKFNVNYPTSEVKFVDHPDAYIGETVTLECKADGFPESTITIDDEERSEITFTVSGDMDGEKFTCAAGSYNSTYTVDILKIDEPSLKGIEIVDDVATAAEGSSVSVSCSARGNPPPSVAWYKENSKFSNDGTLSILDAKFENSGSYMCKATNEYAKLEQATSFTLKVQGLNAIDPEEVPVEGEIDDTVSLECVFEANPKPTITWDVENPKPEESDDGYQYKSKVEVGPLSPEHSEKVFTCTADNGVGVVTKSFKLPVIASSSGAAVAVVVVLLLLIIIAGIVVFVLYRKGIICKKQEKGEESADADIALEINDEDDVEAGNGKPAAEENEPPAANEEEKLMNGDERED